MSSLNDVLERITEVRDEEQEAHENVPESLQETDAYYEVEYILDELDEAISSIEDAISALEYLED